MQSEIEVKTKVYLTQRLMEDPNTTRQPTPLI